jgi:hypothetical protein
METEAEFKLDLIGAVLMIALGIAVTVVGVGYRMGSLTSMGAGYVPVVLGTLMVFMGLLIGITGFASRNKNAKPAKESELVPVAEVGHLPAAPGEGGFQPRGWLCIIGGVAAFVIAGEHVGLVPAIFLSVFLAALGDKKNSWRDSFLLALAITVAGVAIFSYGLKLTFPLFTWA